MLADTVTGDVGRESTLRRWWAVSGLALFAATKGLWTPQTEFPQIPLFGWAGVLPLLVDWLAFGVLLGSLSIAALKPDSWRAWVAFAASLAVLVALDQHRLQPWAWQLLLMAILWSTSKMRQDCNRSCIALTISIYFWSAVSKLDASFMASHGQTLIEALFGAVAVDAVPWPPRWKWWLAFCLPIGELLVAVGLCWQKTRRMTLIGTTALHVGLILALGPLGLGHRPGVLVWNVAFIGHIWLLFGVSKFVVPPSGGAVLQTRNLLKAELRIVLVAFVCLWPAAERWGLCDRWPAWSVYVARSERVSVLLTEEGLRRLPESARRCVRDGELPLDRWSLEALDVPIYPQLRFQLGVVESLRQRCGAENLVEVIVQHFEGRRGELERLTVEQLDARRREFWINTRPRD